MIECSWLSNMTVLQASAYPIADTRKVQPTSTSPHESGRRFGIRDGLLQAIAQGGGEQYLSAFALLLHATPFQLSILSAVPQLLGTWAQLVSVKVSHWFRSLASQVFWGIIGQSVSWIPILVLPLLWPDQGPWILIAAVALFLWLRGRVRWTPGTLAAGLVYAATLSLFVGATKLTTAANAIFLQSTAPLYLLLLAPLVLRERVYLRDVLYLAAIAAGLVFCFAGTPGATATASNPALGTWLGAASGLAWALTLVALRIIGRGDANTTDAVAPVVAGNVLAVLIALPFALPFPRATSPQTVHTARCRH